MSVKYFAKHLAESELMFIFALASLMMQTFYLLNFPVESPPRKRKRAKSYSKWSMRISADFT